MNTFTKADAVRLVSLRTNQTQAMVRDVIDGLFDEIKDALRMDRKVELRGFGVIETRINKARVGRNPSRPELGMIQIPPKRTVKFRMAVEFRREIAKPVKVAEPIAEKPVLTANPIEET